MKNLLTKYQQEKFTKWWSNENTGRPLIVTSVDKEGETPDFQPWTDSADRYLNTDKLVHNYIESLKESQGKCERFPTLDLNLGAGSMALYLGSQAVFAPETLWFKELPYKELADFPKLEFNPENPWFKKHLEIIKRGTELSNGRFMTNVPDIVESLDILAALRDPQTICYDIADDIELVRAKIQEIDNIYMDYYNAFYNIVKLEDNSSVFTAFEIWGPGKTAKIQCDFAALISPKDFDYLVKPSLVRQCDELDNCIYHLDGKECIVHLESLMQINKLKGIQWTQGDGNEDCFSPKWLEAVYKPVAAAGKILHLHSGVLHDVDYYIKGIDTVINAIGSSGLYVNLPQMTREEFEKLMNYSAVNWE